MLFGIVARPSIWLGTRRQVRNAEIVACGSTRPLQPSVLSAADDSRDTSSLSCNPELARPFLALSCYFASQFVFATFRLAEFEVMVYGVHA